MRTRILLALPVVVALGLASRHPAAPHVVHLFVGDALYATLVYLLVRFVAPGSRIGPAAWVALGVCVAVEVSQLWHPAWLDAVRAMRPGALVLGRGFLWSDLGCYAVGVALGAGAEARLRMHARAEDHMPGPP